uniref:Uncharacterized protein n=1 Tax=Panagrolaimus superbus TaxID=310955 RepID=A0A914YEZ2_9BILA
MIQPQVSESTATQVINDISFAISDPNLTRTTEHNVLNSFEPNSQEHSFLDYRNQSIAEISSDIFNRRIYLESFDHEQGIENIEPEERRFTNETDEDLPSFYIHDSKTDRIKADLRIKEAQTMLSKKKLEKYDLNFELKKRIATENETIEEAKLSKVLNIEELKEKIEKKKRKRELRRQE